MKTTLKIIWKFCGHFISPWSNLYGFFLRCALGNGEAFLLSIIFLSCQKIESYTHTHKIFTTTLFPLAVFLTDIFSHYFFPKSHLRDHFFPIHFKKLIVQNILYFSCWRFSSFYVHWLLGICVNYRIPFQICACI